MNIVFKPIGAVRTAAADIPRHWSLSDVEGVLEIDPVHTNGLKDISAGQKIIVLFYFHQSPPFSESLLVQTPPHRNEPLGVFSICSPRRPNPIGLSVLEVTHISGSRVHVRGIDMFDGTPILDIKPYISEKKDCPSYAGQDPAA